MGKDIRDTFFNALYKKAIIDKSIVVITADADAFGLKQFRDNIPDRFINIGVTEQNMINVAAGMAMRGKKVYVYSIIPFLTMRAFEQIKFNLSGMRLAVRLVGIGTGFSFGFDGPSHHGITDIGIMRTVPEMEIYNPCDEFSTLASMNLMNMSLSPTYIRLDKGEYEDIYTWDEIFSGEGEILIDSDHFKKYKYLTDNKKSDILVLSTGYTTHIVMDFIKKYKNEASKINFIDVYQLKNFPDIELKNYKHIIVIEEHSIVGGLFNIICEVVAKNGYKSTVHPITLLDMEYIIYGSREFLLEKSDITPKSLLKTILECRKNV